MNGLKFLLSLILFFSTPALASGVQELADLFASPAGQVIAREMGLTASSRALMGMGGSGLSSAESERLGGYLEEVRERYLEERPGDDELFERGNGVLKPKQDELLAEALWSEADRSPEFVRLGERLRDYRSVTQEFLAGGATPLVLPPKVEVSVNKDQAARLFGIARTGFSGGFSPETLNPLLESLIAGQLDVLTPETKLALKAQRKDASILRNAFALLCDSHEVPAAIQAYASDFGHLNDAIEAGLPEEIRGFARDLDASLDPKKIGRALDRFAPASRDSFDRYTAKLAKNLRGWAAEEELPVEEFHNMRKSLKELMNLLMLYERAGSIASRKAAYDYLYKLNEDMGLMHDEIVAADLRGEVKYKKQTVKVPERFRQGVLDFLARFANVKG